jgi:hypothetical protein
MNLKGLIATLTICCMCVPAMAESTSPQEREPNFARDTGNYEIISADTVKALLNSLEEKLGLNEDDNGLLLLVRGGGQNRHGCRSLKENGCRKPAWNRRDRMCYCLDGGAGLGSMSF